MGKPIIERTENRCFQVSTNPQNSINPKCRPYFEDCESIVAEKCNACLAYFESLGACITDIQIPDLFLLRAAHGVRFLLYTVLLNL